MKKENFSQKVGDAVEHIGQKISNTGATNLGNKVHDTGDKIEHSQDHEKDVGGNIVDRKY